MKSCQIFFFQSLGFGFNSSSSALTQKRPIQLDFPFEQKYIMNMFGRKGTVYEFADTRTDRRTYIQRSMLARNERFILSHGRRERLGLGCAKLKQFMPRSSCTSQQFFPKAIVQASNFGKRHFYSIISNFVAKLIQDKGKSEITCLERLSYF